MKKLLPFLILLFYCYSTFAVAPSGLVKGVVVDKQNGEPLIGATLTLKSKTRAAVSTAAGLDGSFVFRNVPAGTYELEIKYISYQKREVNLELKDGETRALKIALASEGSSLNEVSVKGKADGGSERSAITAERRSDQLINSVSSRVIEASPDVTIANVTQRVSGVSIERSNNGEAQYAIIRGMDQRYLYTLVNGIKIPSPDNKNRYVPLDIFPADIVERLDVIKSLTPSMEGDAIAGAINMVLKDAPDNFTFNVNLGTAYAGKFFNGNGFTQFDHSASLTTSPRVAGNTAATMSSFPNNPFEYNQKKTPLGAIFNATVGGRTADKKFGAIATVSYQNSYRETNGIFFDTFTSGENSQPLLTSEESRKYDIQQQRTAVVTKFDYRFNARNKIDLNADYINLTKNEYRFTSDTDLQATRIKQGAGEVKQDYRSDRTVQQIYNFNLHGDHKLDDRWKLDWSAVYSKATANEPDRADLYIATGGVANAGTGVITQLPDRLSTNQYAQSRVFQKNSDEDKSGYLNLTYSPKIFGTTVDFTAGGMYRDKSRNSTYDQYNLSETSSQIYDGNINDNSFVVQNIIGSPSDELNYNFTEKIGAGYGQFKFTAGNLLAIGGVRYEHTDQNWVTNAPVAIVRGATGSINYYDILPSVSLKYTLDKENKQDLRFSYYSAISRPNFYELIPHVVGDPDADYDEIGNPNLKRITSDNFDLRYEFFPKQLDQLLVGAFYKNIQNPIEYAVVKPTGAASNKYDLEPENFGTAKNYGFELDATKYVRNFGVRLNYTFTNSDITTTKVFNYRQGTDLLSRIVSQTRPLQNQSKNIGNISLLYRDVKSGFDAQVSGVYTGARIYAVSPYLDNDIWQKGFVTLDVSAEKRIFKKFSIYAKATNLTNTPFELEIHQPYTANENVFNYQTVGKNVFVRKDTYQQYYILGLRYKL